MPAVNHQLDEVQQDSCSDPSNNRPTATDGALPMLNLTQTSRKRLGLVHENRKGKASRQRKEQDRQNIQHSDSEDSAIDTIRCEKCGEQDYSAANPILLCDGEECGKGWHLDCIPTQGGKRAAARAAIRTVEDWFCDDSCRHWEFESIEGVRVCSNGEKEYSIKWKGYSQQSWEPARHIDQEHVSAYEALHASASSSSS